MNKKWAALGVSLGVLGGGAAGFAATSNSTPAGAERVATPAQATDTTVADTGSTDDTDRDQDHADHLGEILAPLVEDGTITQAQADAVIGALTEAMPDGRGHGRGGMGGGPGFDGGRLAEIVESLDLSIQEVMEALRDGTSIAELAEQQGVEIDTIIESAVAALKEHLDEEVAEGDLTQAEADERLAEATESITAFVEGDLEFPMGGFGGMGGRGHHGGFGHDDDHSDATTTTTVG